MKRCPRCEEDLEPENFYKDSKSADGLSSWCKDCKKARRKELYKLNPKSGAEWDKKNPEKARERHRRYRKSIDDLLDE